MLNTKHGVAAVGLLGTLLATAASANTSYTWDLTTPSGNVGKTHKYTSNIGNVFLIASGYSTKTKPSSSSWDPNKVKAVDLFAKGSGIGSESGLGLVNDPSNENEISGNSFIQLNVADLFNYNLKQLSIQIGSIQANEGYAVWGSNTAGTPGTFLEKYTNTNGKNKTDVNSFSAPNFGTYKYYSISATNGNVLLDSGISASPDVPEASSIVGMCGMLTVGGLSLRRRRNR